MSTRYDEQVGERIAHIRNILFMSQNKVAAKLGVTRQTLANYESGKTPMRADVVRLLCEVYGVTPSWVLGIDDTLELKTEVEGREIELRETSPHIESPNKEDA